MGSFAVNWSQSRRSTKLSYTPDTNACYHARSLPDGKEFRPREFAGADSMLQRRPLARPLRTVWPNPCHLRNENCLFISGQAERTAAIRMGRCPALCTM